MLEFNLNSKISFTLEVHFFPFFCCLVLFCFIVLCFNHLSKILFSFSPICICSFWIIQKTKQKPKPKKNTNKKLLSGCKRKCGKRIQPQENTWFESQRRDGNHSFNWSPTECSQIQKLFLKQFLHISVSFAVCHLSFLECVQKFGEEKDWEKCRRDITTWRTINLVVWLLALRIH